MLSQINKLEVKTHDVNAQANYLPAEAINIT